MTDTNARSKKWDESTLVENDLCRICLSISDLLIPVFKDEGLEQKLHEKIEKYLPVKILESDALPQQICYHCAGTLIAWDSLYTCCLKTDEKLQSLIHSAEQNTTHTTNKELDSDEEVLMPPKKRKPIEVNNKEEIGTIVSLSKADKTKQRACNLKKSKKLCKSNESKLNKEGEKENVGSKTLDKATLLTIIKTECESEDDSHDHKGDLNEEEAVTASSLKCEFCNKSYKDRKCLNRHVKKSHDGDKSLEALRCDVCNNIYKTRANLERHYLKEHLTNQVQCPVCHAFFNSKKLDFHLKSVHGVKTEKSENEEKFKCKLCEKWFKNKYVRNSHVKEVHLSEPMKCKLCDFEGVRTVLRRHKRDVHAEKRFLCSLCPGAFKTLHTLKMHMTSHSDIRCYTCDVCGMGFKRLNNVRDHMKCHERKSNQCQICGNFFARKRYLAIHEKTIHNFYADGIVPEEKGFECEICGAKLKWKKNLLAHMRIHTGEKPYVCKICNKDFICHGSLRTHMAKHSVCITNETDSQNHVTEEINSFGNFNTEPV